MQFSAANDDDYFVWNANCFIADVDTTWISVWNSGSAFTTAPSPRNFVNRAFGAS